MRDNYQWLIHGVARENERMKIARLGSFTVVMIPFLLAINPAARGQELAPTSADSNVNGDGAGLVVGHPFSAVKYARTVRVLPDGKQQFIRNDRYPAQIARDADGRVMMQKRPTDHLSPECEHLEVPVPPACPTFGSLIIDPVSHTVTSWLEGEFACHCGLDFPLSEARLEYTIHATTDVPDIPPPFTDEDGKVSTEDLGDRLLEGVQAHGVRSTLRYTKTDLGETIQVVRIHEVWTAPEMKLIVRVVDGDPNGIETVWGLEKISLSPDPSLFQPPPDYPLQHDKTDPETARYTWHDFEYLESWFAE